MSASEIKSRKVSNEANNNLRVQIGSNIYRIIAQRLGRTTLVDAECIMGPDRGQLINLKESKSNTALEIRGRISANLLS